MNPWTIAAVGGVLLAGVVIGIHVFAAIEESGLVEECLEGT